MDDKRVLLVEELNQAMQRSGNLTVLFTHAIAEQVGLSATEFESLDVLGNCGSMTAGQLARACGLSTGGVTGMVDRLEKAGFVKRVPDARDRRKVIVERIESETLHRKVVELYRPVAAGFTEIVSHYSDEQIETILDFMNRANAMVETVRTQFENSQDQL